MAIAIAIFNYAVLSEKSTNDTHSGTARRGSGGAPGLPRVVVHMVSHFFVLSRIQPQYPDWAQKQRDSRSKKICVAAVVLGIRLTVTLPYRKKGPPSCF